MSDANAEVVIHLDMKGLAALLHAMQAALESGRGEVACGRSGVAARGGSGAFGTVAFTFGRPDPNADEVPADARPVPTRSLEPAL